MTHPNEQLIRELYAEFSKGNLDGVLALCTPDMRFHFGGHNALTGDYDREGLARFAMKFGQIAGPSLRINLDAVLANDERGVVFLRDTFTRQDNGKSYDVRLLHVYRIENGKLASLEEVPFDPSAVDEAWSTSCAPAPHPPEPVHSIH
ncbi:nuclear transport factor 2 family protein [Vitiosangium sp. GDMCC 1.1324]|uniref:nuclear transport factor 2 family protein n=1 Tax=Vitiosangium sp. (strain GDMCC 1.1324) TaxID=2138576 RepID=UPI00130EF801|nr:nuclear transport factor 2 family protein [Vitiosangium sp. GDMCC 1.1324]